MSDMESTFRGFESENEALAQRRERSVTFGYRLADVCLCRVPGVRAHLGIDHDSIIERKGQA
jgi:hypothetical protein